jgi:2'-5' RNA ligase
MRLFVAVDVDDHVRQQALAAIDRLRAACEARGTGRAGWVSAERLHLTLLFIGEVPEPAAEDIGRRLAAPLATEPFRLEFGGLEFFPASGRARVAWLSVTRGSEALGFIRGEVDRRLDGVPFRREERPFAPHLTLARFREPLRADDREAATGVALDPVGGCTIDRVTLYRSRLSPHGPTYTSLQATRLGRTGLEP